MKSTASEPGLTLLRQGRLDTEFLEVIHEGGKLYVLLGYDRSGISRNYSLRR